MLPNLDDSRSRVLIVLTFHSSFSSHSLSFTGCCLFNAYGFNNEFNGPRSDKHQTQIANFTLMTASKTETSTSASQKKHDRGYDDLLPIQRLHQQLQHQFVAIHGQTYKSEASLVGKSFLANPRYLVSPVI